MISFERVQYEKRKKYEIQQNTIGVAPRLKNYLFSNGRVLISA